MNRPGTVKQFGADRLSPRISLGLHFMVGVAVLVMASWIFGSIAVYATDDGPLSRMDQRAALWLAAHRVPWLTMIMRAVSHAHDTVVTIALTSAFAVYLAIRGLRYWLLALLVAVPGGMAAVFMQKLAFHRARPSPGEALAVVTTYSFPSGHTAAATLFYGFCAVFLARAAIAWSVKLAIAGATCAIVLFVAFARMYLGVHYLSDVLGAVTAGAAWLAFTFTGIRLLQWWQTRE